MGRLGGPSVPAECEAVLVTGLQGLAPTTGGVQDHQRIPEPSRTPEPSVIPTKDSPTPRWSQVTPPTLKLHR